MHFSPTEAAACHQLLALALREDLGPDPRTGDLTSRALIPADATGHAALVARAPGVLAGLPAVALTLVAVDPKLTLEPLLRDGAPLTPGARIAIVRGPLGSLLTAERTALNFLQHLSGVASLTRRYVEAVAGTEARILDTRKTLPGWRLLDKYAVRCGGGYNHRLGLFDGVLIKDNHLAAGAAPLPIAEAVRRARAASSPGVPVELEVDTFDQLDEALACRPDIVLLDNMTNEQLREAVQRRDHAGCGALLEASGGVTLATVRGIAETGVDRISVGALTHSAPALDIGLDAV